MSGDSGEIKSEKVPDNKDTIDWKTLMINCASAVK